MTTTTAEAGLQLAAALLDAIDPLTEIRYRRQLAREAAMRERERSWSEGYAAAVEDTKRAQHDTVRALRLELARTAPGGVAWLAAVERHGGTEFGGVGRPRVPVPPEVIARVRREVGGVAR